MPFLSDLQLKWQESILTKRLQHITPAIAQPPRDSIETRVNIYADGYLWRLIEVLEIIFPYFKKYVGVDKFCEIAEAYFSVYPSHYFAIREVGKHLADFLTSTNEHRVYADLAALEFAISEAVDKATATPLTREVLQLIPQEEWGNVVFTLHPSFALLELSTNAVLIYESLIKDQPLPAPQMSKTTYCRIWRKDLQVYYFVAQNSETIFLQYILQEATFGEVCEKLCEVMPEEDVVSYAINQLLTWLDEGMLIEAKVKGIA